MLGRQRICAGLGIMLDNAGDGHGAKPFAYVALLKPRFGGKFGAGCLRSSSHRIEEAGPMTDRNHQTQGTAIEDAHYFPRESFRARGIAWGVANFRVCHWRTS